MSLDILLEPITRATEKLPCKVGRFQLTLDEPYRSALVTLLETTYQLGGLSDEDLTQRLNQAGCDVGATVVYKHRRGKCTCV
jgi:hypothetical protein